MRRVRIVIVGLSALALIGCLHAPVLWSPDGHWLAYTMAFRSEPAGLSPGWLFETAAPEGAALSAAPTGRLAPLTYRLWATRAETRESVLLEESRGPLTSPTWSPD